jgi:transglutaminase-like putative cysteine protease
LQKQIEQWQAASTNSEHRLLHALEFVQDEVRYLGMEGGIQSHKPSDPSLVFARRYGDCKDKALLLCTILTRLGVEASPALVNARGKVDPTMASPNAFNHAIVRAKLGEKTLWVDPTLSYQKGPLHSRYLPDYGDALVLLPTTQELVTVPRSTNGAPRTIVRESLALNASDRFSSLRVATSMEGRDAETFRASIAAGLGEALSQSRLTSYARYYPHIRTNAPCRIEETTNHIMQVTDDYSVPEIWSSGEAWRLNFDYFAQELGNLLGLAVNPQRTMPVGIEYPCHRIHTTVLHLPASHSMRDTVKVIRGPAEELRFKRTSSGKTMTLEYDYRSTAGTVAVADLNEHLKARREMLDCLGFSLWWRPEMLHRTSTMPRTPRGPMGWTILIFCVGMVVLWNVFNRRRSREAPAF